MIQTNKPEWEISSSAEITDYITKNGFSNIISFKNGVNGKPYVYKNNKIYALLDNVEGEKLELTNKESIIEFASLLGNFHSCAEGFTKPPGMSMKTEWGKLIVKFKTMTRRVEKYIKIINETGKTNSFEIETWDYLESIMKRAATSLKIFKSKEYLNALEKSMFLREVCLNSISDDGVVINKGEMIITNVFDFSYNMNLEDLSKLIKKSFESNNPKIMYDEVISAYSRVRYIDENSRNIVNAMITFPYDSMKVINRYMNKMGEEALLLEKFKRYYKREQRDNIWGE